MDVLEYRGGYSYLKWYFIALFNIVFTVLLIFCAKNQILPFTNHFIPDATYYENHVFELTDRGLYNGFTEINKVLFAVGPQSFLFYNTALIIGSIYLCSQFSVFSKKSVIWAQGIIACNPYLLISVVGPSKECNLTFFSLLSLYFFLRPGLAFKMFALAIASIVVFIRPQFGACLFVTYLMYAIILVVRRPIFICGTILVSFFILNAIPFFNSIIVDNQGGEELPFFSGSVIYEVAIVLQVMSADPILQLPAFLVKSCLILFTPIARPNPITSHYIPLLDWGYTLMANILFPFNLGFLLLFLNKKALAWERLGPEGQLLIVYCFIGMLSVIISPSIQFRYLFPYAPIIAAAFMLHQVHIRNRILVFSWSIMLTMFVLTAIFLQRDIEYTDYIPYYLSWL